MSMACRDICIRSRALDFCAREAFGMTEIGPALYMPIEAIDMVGSGSCGIPAPFASAVSPTSAATLPAKRWASCW